MSLLSPGVVQVAVPDKPRAWRRAVGGGGTHDVLLARRLGTVEVDGGVSLGPELGPRW